MGVKDFVKDFLDWRANSRMTPKEKAYAEELGEFEEFEEFDAAQAELDATEAELLAVEAELLAVEAELLAAEASLEGDSSKSGYLNRGRVVRKRKEVTKEEKDADNWIDLDDDEMLPTFDCIILLRDTNCKRYLVARYEFETIYPIPYSSGSDYYNDDGGWDWHFYDTETDQEYDADEICMTYSQLMVIKRIYSDNF